MEPLCFVRASKMSSPPSYQEAIAINDRHEQDGAPPPYERSRKECTDPKYSIFLLILLQISFFLNLGAISTGVAIQGVYPMLPVIIFGSLLLVIHLIFVVISFVSKNQCTTMKESCVLQTLWLASRLLMLIVSTYSKDNFVIGFNILIFILNLILLFLSLVIVFVNRHLYGINVQL